MNKEEPSSSRILGLAWGLGYRIALPIIVFGVLGRIIDKQLGTSFAFLLLGIFFALVVTTLLIQRQLKEVLEEVENETKQ